MTRGELLVVINATMAVTTGLYLPVDGRREPQPFFPISIEAEAGQWRGRNAAHASCDRAILTLPMG